MRTKARSQESEVRDQHPAARSVLECGGKRSTMPLSEASRPEEKRRRHYGLPERGIPPAATPDGLKLAFYRR